MWFQYSRNLVIWLLGKIIFKNILQNGINNNNIWQKVIGQNKL